MAALTTCAVHGSPSEAELMKAVETYFNDLFVRLGKVAEQSPTEKNFRHIIKPQIEKVDGFFGATFINAEWEIRQVYFKRNFLAVGFSLKKVKELDNFRKLMDETPMPQLSEPGRGNIVQPRLIALRCPIIKKGKMTSMVSMMIRTEAFLKAVGLDACNAYKIPCRGSDAETKGTLSESHKQVTLNLPSTQWVIKYE
ncbi:MAG: hypothetical protein PHU80_02190 [Kiritimatiellae bacterium]|nr:hypothetical protein [Kiritimatiellia bacterium]